MNLLKSSKIDEWSIPQSFFSCSDPTIANWSRYRHSADPAYDEPLGRPYKYVFFYLDTFCFTRYLVAISGYSLPHYRTCLIYSILRGVLDNTEADVSFEVACRIVQNNGAKIGFRLATRKRPRSKNWKRTIIIALNLKWTHLRLLYTHYLVWKGLWRLQARNKEMFRFL